MGADDTERKEPSKRHPATPPLSGKNPYIDWIFCGRIEAETGVRLGIAATIIIALGLIWIVWSVWPMGGWVKPATSEIQMQEDRSACRAIASKKDSPLGMSSTDRYSSDYKACMETKGYSLKK